MIKRIIWEQYHVPKGGFALKNFLNANNFQPGKFEIVDNCLDWLVLAVKEEAPMQQ